MEEVMYSTDAVQRSVNDQREYRAMVLKNGAKILLISDPETDRAAAALDVHIGALSDPALLPGLAHFCEHMVFLGTAKYPQENALKKFLACHSGSCNAFTSNDHTNYYFDVAPEHLLKALDIFAQLFVCPLFTDSAVEREVSAIHSEYEKDLQNDTYRLYQLHRSLSCNGHAFGKLICGNKSTLSDAPKAMGMDIREALLSFHAKHYSSNIMCICIIGKESLDVLAEWSVRLFAPMQDREVVIPIWKQHPFGIDETGILVKAVPVADNSQIILKWPIPDTVEHWKSKPARFVACQLMYGGEGSLLQVSKDLGWVNSISASETSDARGFQFFSLDLDLTTTGIDHLDDIVLLVYQYLHLLSESSLQEWIFEEEKELLEIHFSFKDKEPPLKFVSGIARDMHDYPLECVIRGPHTWQDYRPSLISMVMDFLRPENMTLIATSKKFEEMVDRTERWYGTAYSVTQIEDELMQKWKSAGPSAHFFVRGRNVYIPRNFELCKPVRPETEYPELIKDSSFIRCWHKQDNVFLLPKAYVTLSLSSPHIERSPRNVNLTNVFVLMFNDSLTRHSYQAEVAGLTFSFRKQWHSVMLTVEGFSDRLSVLLNMLLRRLTTFRVERSRFDVVKREYLQELLNFPAQSPIAQCFHYFTLCVNEAGWTKAELLSDLEAADNASVDGYGDSHLAIGPDVLQHFIDQLLTDVHVDMLVYGNMTTNAATELASTAESVLVASRRVRPLPPSLARRQFRLVQLPAGSCYRYCVSNDVHPNSFVLNYYQFGEDDLHRNVLVELFVQLVRDHCFDVLRTQEQLGYIVNVFWIHMGGIRGLVIFLLSPKPPAYVEQRMDAFVETLEAFLTSMGSEEFQKHKQALAAKKLEKPKNMAEQDVQYWNEIDAERYTFNRDRVEVAHLASVTKEDIIELYETCVRRAGKLRRKFVIHVTGVERHAEGGLPGECSDKAPAVDVEDHVAFKQGLGLHPQPTSRYGESRLTSENSSS